MHTADAVSITFRLLEDQTSVTEDPKDALNLPSPEQPTTYQQAVAEITRKGALLILDAHNQQAKGKAWDTLLENKILPTYLPISVFAANFRLTGHDYLQRHLNRIGIRDSPTWPLGDDAEEMHLGHIQKCQSLTDNTDKANNRDKWWNIKIILDCKEENGRHLSN
jgi:hypothetical protein